jgi:hypothetical protein
MLILVAAAAIIVFAATWFVLSRARRPEGPATGGRKPVFDEGFGGWLFKLVISAMVSATVSVLVARAFQQ